MFTALTLNSDNYPLESFPLVLKNAVIGVRQITKAPIALVAASALGSAATASQGIANVQRPTLPKPIPLSLNLLTIAESGERKSVADSYFFEPIYAFDKAQRNQYDESLKSHSIEAMLWKSKVKGLEQRINKTIRAGSDASVPEQELRELHCLEPRIPICMRIVNSDITPAALAAELANNPCTATLHSNEAADLIRGPAMGNLAFLNRAWDGQTIEIVRKDARQNLWVQDARLTTVLAVQPDTFKILCEAKDSHARHSGYLARALIAYPTSTAGQREVDIFDDAFHMPNSIQCYQDKIQFLLNRAVERHTNGQARSVMSFSPQAKAVWVHFFNQVEVTLTPNGGYYYLIKDFAAKAAEHAARIAAIFELFNSVSDVISEDSVQRAIQVVTWYLLQFDRLFGNIPLQNGIQENAENLLSWMQQKSFAYSGQGPCVFSRRYIMQYGPKATRRAEHLKPVIEHLLLSADISLHGFKDFTLKTYQNIFHQPTYWGSIIPPGIEGLIIS